MHPVAAFLVAAIAAWLVVLGISIAVGLLVTEVIVPIDAVSDADEWLPSELEEQRTPFLTDASVVLEFLSGGKMLPGILIVTTIVCAWFRRWRIAAFLVFALGLESATYRVTSILTPRERPDVERLEMLDPDASYPSGHTAASIAVYVGLAALATSRIRHRGARIAIWTVALLIPPIVALARMYRGMHHPLDVLGGVLVGVLALLVIALFASRVAGAVQEERRGQTRSRALPAEEPAR